VEAVAEAAVVVAVAALEEAEAVVIEEAAEEEVAAEVQALAAEEDVNLSDSKAQDQCCEHHHANAPYRVETKR